MAATAAGIRGASMAVAAALLLTLTTSARALAQSEPIDPQDQDAPLDIDIDDRTDPVRPGEEVVYEIELENFTSQTATGVVVTDTLPAGTTFVVAHREPDWAVVPAQVFADRVELDVGTVDPCDHAGTPRCRDIWLTLRVDIAATPGGRIENVVAVDASDTATFPHTEARTITTVGTAAIRSAVLRVGRPGRDNAVVELDLARAGLRTRLDPPPANIDLSQGIHLRATVPGGATLIDASIPATSLRCTNPSADPNRYTNCSLRDPLLTFTTGLSQLRLSLRPYIAVQRNNARVRLRLKRLDLPADTTDGLDVVLEAGGDTYADGVPLALSTSGLVSTYSKRQGEP